MDFLKIAPAGNHKKNNQSFSRWDRIRLIRGSFMAQIVSGHWEVRIGQHNPGHGLLLLQRGRAQGPRASQMDFNVNVLKKQSQPSKLMIFEIVGVLGFHLTSTMITMSFSYLFVTILSLFKLCQVYTDKTDDYFSPAFDPPQITHKKKRQKQNSQGKKQRHGDQKKERQQQNSQKKRLV